MFVIKYSDGIYAGTWKDENGEYCYSPNESNKCMPKVFKTLSGARKHLERLEGKVPFPDDHNFWIEEWSEMDLKTFLDKIGITDLYTKKQKCSSELKYWRKIFKPVKGEVEVKRIEIKDKVCTVFYLMPYSRNEEEFEFDITLPKEVVTGNFCDEVEERGRSMIQMIDECSKDVRNLF